MTMLTYTGSRHGIKILCWMLLLICVTAGQQRGINGTKKTPEDLVCYQNYTLKDNFCYCSWRAGEESQNPTYRLHYCIYKTYNMEYEYEYEYFDVGKPTYYILTNDMIHMRENISIAVEAEENGQSYTSKKITLILDKAVKLDPPDHNKITMTREGNNITVSWTRSDLFPVFLKTTKEVRYMESSLYTAPLPCQTTTPTNCHQGCKRIPMYKENCKFAVNGNNSYYIQIRQKYEEGVWSEWSDSIFVPAEIRPIKIEKINTSRLNLAGSRTTSLFWKHKTEEEEGDVTYQINVTFLHCSHVSTSHSTKDNWFHTNLSGAAYNVTVTASNEAQTATLWSTVIDEDGEAIPFQNVTLSGNNLTMKWKGKIARKSLYCMTWQTSEKKEVFSNLIEKLNNNIATISTDHFLQMKCYKIDIYKMGTNQITVGTTYYFKPSLTVGPRNLTVLNVTINSLLLKWDAFTLHECQRILQNWVINRKDHAANVSKETYENSSVTQYLVEGLPLGFNYTFEVKGITIFGEQTGSSFKSVSSPWTVESTNKRLLEKIVGILVALLIAGLGILFLWFKINQCICKDLPNPGNSNAATFVPGDNKYILSPQHLAQPSTEEKNTEPLIIETSMQTECFETMMETEMLDSVNTKELLDDEFVMPEVDADLEMDLQSAYRKQTAPMTPTNEKDIGLHFFEKMKTTLPHHLECSKENDSLLSLNDVNISTGES
ncbi:interleukin-12 receptor subunit beta-1 [Leptodactylus fuscus]|uniref:interleukin-12 receptor subunit beta-1 n=1 Tax=Leptodactylus fuscus TaxID=238119 RepID=UPI003F4E476C